MAAVAGRSSVPCRHCCCVKNALLATHTGASRAEPGAKAEKPAAGAERIIAEGLDAAQAHRAVGGAVILRHRRRPTSRSTEGTRAARGLTAAQYLDIATGELCVTSALATKPGGGCCQLVPNRGCPRWLAVCVSFRITADLSERRGPRAAQACCHEAQSACLQLASGRVWCRL